MSLKETETYAIENIIVCDNFEIANQIARASYGDDAIAIETTLYPVSIGDTYVNDIFYDKDGKEIPRNITEQEEIADLKQLVSKQEAEIEILNNTLLEVLMM